MSDKNRSVKSRYTQLESVREPFLNRGRACSEITVPYLLPPDGAESSSYFLSPYQSVGAQGINNLSAKILLTMLPDNEVFFRMGIDAQTAEEIGLSEGEADVAMSEIERKVQLFIEQQALRVPVFEGIKHLLVTGNTLLFLTPEGAFKVFRLDRYVVRRDTMGNVVEIIVKECIHPSLLPESVKDAQNRDGDKDGHIMPEDRQKNPRKRSEKEEYEKIYAGSEDDEHVSEHKDLELFTYVRRMDNGKWLLTQEVEGCMVPEATTVYPKNRCPFMALRLNALDGEDYGRGFTEEYYGDLRSLEDLTKSMVEAAQQAATVKWLVRPNGLTRPRTVEELPNGGIGSGSADDVSCIQMEKQADFSVARQQMEEITRRMEGAFLMGSSIQRRGERVTAEEIRYLATELEQGLGGIYSLLAVTLQKPLVELIIFHLDRKNELPEVPLDILNVAIVTGLAALGRSNDLQRLVTFRNEIAQAAAMLQQGATFLNPNEYILRVAVATGIDPANLVKTEEQTATENQQASQQATQQQIITDSAPSVINEMVKAGLPQPQV